MLNKKDFHPCPVGLFLQLVGNKWKILIIRDLLTGTKRFGQLRRSVGCSQKVLTDNLRDLEENGLLLRKVYAEIPPRVEYTLSPTGDSLRPVLDTIAAWGESYRQSR
ncbi:MAG: helix-turn-helix domain-containing protein [Elusimicrobiales bacterium]|nr:helix-turn-helix domain-containing protein [Elusimicrobiales bacterium]